MNIAVCVRRGLLSLGMISAGCATLCAWHAGVAWAAPPAAGEFPAVLETAGISTAQLSLLADDQDGWSDEQRDIAAELTHLLANFQVKQLDLWTAGGVGANWPVDAVGALMWVAGNASSCARRDPYVVCVVESETPAGPFLLMTAQTPRAWAADGDLLRPSGVVRARAVLLGQTEWQGQTLPCFLTERLQWRPTSDAPAGWLTLAEAGFDVALLDEIRHHAPLAAGGASREGEAFYGMLRAAGQFTTTELAARTRRALPERTAAWERVSAQAAGPKEGDPGQRRQAVAQAAARRATLGFSSVAPLFLAPQDEVGRLALIEGTARRAVPIALDAGGAGMAPDRYYELEVFTPDSQNLPVVCCVASLPPGFPIGDAIREPVRVAGFFFKVWQYRSREGGEGAKSKAYAPILIGPAPAWVRQQPAGGSSWLGASLGVLFLAILAGIGWVLWRQSARDRQARRRVRDRESPGPIQLPD